MSTSPEYVQDAEFGAVRVKRNAQAKHVRLRIQPDGELLITLPSFAAQRHAQKLLDTSREEIRTWKERHMSSLPVFQDGDLVGHSHVVRFVETPRSTPSVHTQGLTITVHVPEQQRAIDPTIQKTLRPHIEKAIQKEARAYLPRRLKFLAEKYDFSFERTRFGTQKGRWGSCSAAGTISMNIGLMLLDDELIDYVLIHELCHTRQMNHSTAFWDLVEQCLPEYKKRRAALKKIHPLF